MAKNKYYNYPLRLHEENKKPLEKLAIKNKTSLNDEINLAVKFWIKKTKEELSITFKP